MKSILLIGAVAALCGLSHGFGQLLGSEKCTWGPAYWCSSNDTAKECGEGATLHCQTYVWKTASSAVQSFAEKKVDPAIENALSGFLIHGVPMGPVFSKKSQKCIQCTAFVVALRKELKQSALATKAALKATCAKIAPAKLSAKCEYVVERGFELLKSKTSPAEVCKTFGQCDKTEAQFADEMQSVLASPVESFEQKRAAVTKVGLKSSGTHYCFLCKIVVGRIEKMLKEKKKEQEIEHEVEKICSVLPKSASADCQKELRAHLPDILKHLASGMPASSICQLIGICKARGQVARFEKSVSTNTDFCYLCKVIVGKVDAMLKDKKTDQEIEAEVMQLCSDLPSSVSGECKNVVQTYLPTIIQYLASELSASTVCEMIGLCKAPAANKKLASSASTEYCPLCKIVVGQVDSMLKDNKTVHEIEAEVAKLCGDLPSSVSGECKNVAETYLPTIMRYLASELAPSTVCEMIGLCKAAVGKQVSSLRGSGETCYLCKIVVEKVDAMLKDKKTEQEIEDEAMKLCNDFSSPLSNECKSVVQANLPTVLKYLASELSSSTICEMIHLCKAAIKKGLQSSLRGSGETCYLCKFVVEKVDAMLKDKKTDQEIAAEAEKLCTDLPGSVSSECKSVVQNNLPSILKYLGSELSPDTVCEMIHLCKAAAKTGLTSAKKVGAVKTSFCPLCETVVKKVDFLLKNKKTQEEIEVELDGLCHSLPPSFSGDCKRVVNAYLPTIMKYLAQELQPTVICQMIGLCKTTVAATLRAKIEFCPLCKIVVEKVDELLKNHKAQAEIESELDRVCVSMPGFTKECRRMINAYLPKIMDLLAQELSPAMICAKLGLCTKAATTTKVAAQLLVVTEFSFHGLCPICKSVMSNAEHMIKKGMTPAQLRAEMMHRCRTMPIIVNLMCEKFVKKQSKHMDEIFTFLAKKEDPALVCHRIDICPAPKTKAAPKAQAKALPKAIDGAVYF